MILSKGIGPSPRDPRGKSNTSGSKSSVTPTPGKGQNSSQVIVSLKNAQGLQGREPVEDQLSMMSPKIVATKAQSKSQSTQKVDSPDPLSRASMGQIEAKVEDATQPIILSSNLETIQGEYKINQSSDALQENTLPTSVSQTLS